MESFLEWLQNLPVSLWITESESLWAFPLVLFLHTVGIALTAGSSFMLTMSTLGRLGPISPTSLRKLFFWFWVGFVVNAASGTLLFMSAATVTAYKVTYQLKLVLIVLGVATLVPIKTFLDKQADLDARIPMRIRTLAVASLLAWAGAIFTGRFIAYL